MPEGTQPIIKGDAFYSNVVNAQGGNDIVIAGKGDNYVIDATYVHINAGSNDDNFISTPDIIQLGSGKDFSKKKTNPRVGVIVNGGSETHVFAADEFDFSNHAPDVPGEQGKKGVTQWEDSYIDDFFDINSSTAYFSNPIYDAENASDQWTQGGLNKADMAGEASDRATAIWEELLRVPDVDESATETTWDEVMGQKSILDDEMNGFFGEMFGEMNGFMSEMNMGFEDDTL